MSDIVSFALLGAGFTVLFYVVLDFVLGHSSITWSLLISRAAFKLYYVESRTVFSVNISPLRQRTSEDSTSVS